MTTWDPEHYLLFDDHRSRPFVDLIARIGAPADGPGAPRRVIDLGCGPGHLTELLAARWPAATITAFDSSPQMVDAARKRGIDAELADAADWMPAEDTDVIVTNAVLHWLPEHRALIARWVSALPDGAWFAMQVPGNFAAPSHTLIRELAAEPPWADRLSPADDATVADPAAYAQILAATGADVDAWETTYIQRLTGPDPVLGWIESTALRPVRDTLGPDYPAFRDALAPRLRAAYPSSPDGSTWFPFRRIFAVAHT